ncbi:MAG: CDP-diacylglycerol--glycerol-3-phosphate 3-phosphatidyltransferase [Lachnospiraceae bacterium]|nr:CDP-diacylglycerol--glycerol-3-phosphate 3-phosphatidyltransferase [Lachnospiraceae bacterium]MDY5741781.1 CDP-diacylglycerol--glycerol-3-phosphate 3-phosphatidyltransferase [Lachnospiraceae bacterium]
MNTPNKITLFRIVLIPFFVLLMLIPQVPANNWIAAVIFVVASLTDFVDGYLARKYKLVTNFGKFMDPLADKLLVCAALICLVDVQRIPGWIVIIIISREFIISGFRLLASDQGVVIAAGWWGKAKTFTQMIMLTLFILNLGRAAFWPEQILLYLSLLLTMISLVDYLLQNKNILKSIR